MLCLVLPGREVSVFECMDRLHPISSHPFRGGGDLSSPQRPSKAPQCHQNTLGALSEGGRAKVQESPTPSIPANPTSGEQQKGIQSWLNDGKQGSPRAYQQLRVLKLC